MLYYQEDIGLIIFSSCASLALFECFLQRGKLQFSGPDRMVLVGPMQIELCLLMFYKQLTLI